MHTNKNGFTLIEMIITIVLLVILLMLAFPILTNLVTNSSSDKDRANAAAIFAVADNLLYNDLILQTTNQYDCHSGCQFASSDTALSPKHAELNNAILAEIPSMQGTYWLDFDGVKLQILYFKKGKTPSDDASLADGKYPEHLANYPT